MLWDLQLSTDHKGFEKGKKIMTKGFPEAGRPVALTPGNRAEFSISIDLHPLIDSG